MNEISILAEKINYLTNYIEKQFSESKGLRLNSNDWKVYIHVKTPQLYSFVINGTLKFQTDSYISGKSYTQYVKLSDYKKLEAPLLLLFLVGATEQEIINYIVEFFSRTEVKLYCNDPSFSYWGTHYNLTQINSIYGPVELRPPKIRDPRNNNFACKHLWLVLQYYKENIQQFVKNLIPYYKRLFGIQSPQGIERLKKNMGIKGFQQIVEQAIKNLISIDDNFLYNKFDELTKNRLKLILDEQNPMEITENKDVQDAIDDSK